jgi:hypothetical protein
MLAIEAFSGRCAPEPLEPDAFGLVGQRSAFMNASENWGLRRWFLFKLMFERSQEEEPLKLTLSTLLGMCESTTVVDDGRLRPIDDDVEKDILTLRDSFKSYQSIAFLAPFILNSKRRGQPVDLGRLNDVHRHVVRLKLKYEPWQEVALALSPLQLNVERPNFDSIIGPLIQAREVADGDDELEAAPICIDRAKLWPLHQLEPSPREQHRAAIIDAFGNDNGEGNRTTRALKQNAGLVPASQRVQFVINAMKSRVFGAQVTAGDWSALAGDLSVAHKLDPQLSMDATAVQLFPVEGLGNFALALRFSRHEFSRMGADELFEVLVSDDFRRTTYAAECNAAEATTRDWARFAREFDLPPDTQPVTPQSRAAWQLFSDKFRQDCFDHSDYDPRVICAIARSEVSPLGHRLARRLGPDEYRPLSYQADNVDTLMRWLPGNPATAARLADSRGFAPTFIARLLRSSEVTKPAGLELREQMRAVREFPGQTDFRFGAWLMDAVEQKENGSVFRPGFYFLWAAIPVGWFLGCRAAITHLQMDANC